MVFRGEDVVKCVVKVVSSMAVCGCDAAFEQASAIPSNTHGKDTDN
jgi:hypothetical protein